MLCVRQTEGIIVDYVYPRLCKSDCQCECVCVSSVGFGYLDIEVGNVSCLACQRDTGALATPE